MKNVLLRFDSLLNLWCFKQKAQLHRAEIIATKNLLICNLSDGQVQKAIANYKTKLLASFKMASNYQQ